MWFCGTACNEYVRWSHLSRYIWKCKYPEYWNASVSPNISHLTFSGFIVHRFSAAVKRKRILGHTFNMSSICIYISYNCVNPDKNILWGWLSNRLTLLCLRKKYKVAVFTYYYFIIYLNINFELIYSPTKAKTKTRKAFTPRQKTNFWQRQSVLCTVVLCIVLWAIGFPSSLWIRYPPIPSCWNTFFGDNNFGAGKKGSSGKIDGTLGLQKDTLLSSSIFRFKRKLAKICPLARNWLSFINILRNVSVFLLIESFIFAK